MNVGDGTNITQNHIDIQTPIEWKPKTNEMLSIGILLADFFLILFCILEKKGGVGMPKLSQYLSICSTTFFNRPGVAGAVLETASSLTN